MKKTAHRKDPGMIPLPCTDTPRYRPASDALDLAQSFGYPTPSETPPLSCLTAGALGSGRLVADRVDSFFEELGRRGHDPLLDRVTSTGRFDVSGDGQTNHWLITIQAGDIVVWRGEDEEVDWVVDIDRQELSDVIAGETGSLAAWIRGTFKLEINDRSTRFFLLTRLFAGSPESRGRSVWTSQP